MPKPLKILLLSLLLPFVFREGRAQSPTLVLEKLGDSIQVACSKFRMGPADGSKLNKNEREIDSLVTLIEKGKPDTNMVLHVNRLSRILAFSANFEGVISTGLMAARLSNLLNFGYGESRGYKNAAIGYRDKGNYAQALHYSQEALKIFMKGGEANEIGTGLNSVANIYMAMEDYPKALLNFRKGNSAINGWNAPEDKKHKYRNFIGIGLCHKSLGDLDSALYYIHLAETTFRAFNENHGLCKSYVDLGEVYAQKKNNSRAKEYLFKAIELSQKTGDELQRSKANGVMGNILLEEKQYGEAKKFFLEAIRFVEGNHQPPLVIIYYQNYATALAATGNFEQAYKYESRARILSDSMSVVERVKEFNNLKTQYEVDKKANEVRMEGEMKMQRMSDKAARDEWKSSVRLYLVSGALLFAAAVAVVLFFAFRRSNRDKKVIESQRARLEESLAEREALIREIHHRVKNNLQVISGLLSLQGHQAQSEEFRNIMREGQSRVRSMALIHQMLYQHENLSAIPFADYLKNLTREIAATYGKEHEGVKIEIQADNSTFDVDLAIPLGLIVNELVSNAYKYAFDSVGDKIRIQLEGSPTQGYNLAVSDNGKGLPENFILGESKSLGLRLVQMLCKQIRADLEVQKQPGAGFFIHFNLPVIQS